MNIIIFVLAVFGTVALLEGVVEEDLDALLVGASLLVISTLLFVF